MGGRGSGSGAKGGSGATKIPLASGGYIDLTGMPLKYGKNDPFVDKKLRAELDRFEKAHRDDTDREYGMLLDEHGRVLADIKGNDGYVDWNNVPFGSYVKAYVLSHSHNRNEAGLLGATFSIDDIRNHIQKFQNAANKRNTMRAAAKEGTYSLSNRSNFNGDALLDAYKKFHRKSATERGKKIRALEAQYYNGEIQYAQYRAGSIRENNAHFVRLHNFFLENQSNYGYNYTLERRRK